MLPKPAHLDESYASQFTEESVAAAYPNRPPYSKAVFPLLASLIAKDPRAVLDIGCGTGDIARPLAPLVERLDAVDISAPMIALGKRLPNGVHPALTWILGRAEDADLDPPYGLVTAGESIHWMAWDHLLPRCRRLLVDGGLVAIIGRHQLAPAWDTNLADLVARWSTNREFQAYDIVQELTMRNLFRVIGTTRTEPEVHRQSPAAYIEAFHSRNGFSRERMRPTDADAFDRELASWLSPFCRDGMIDVHTTSGVIWGEPLNG